MKHIKSGKQTFSKQDRARKKVKLRIIIVKSRMFFFRIYALNHVTLILSEENATDNFKSVNALIR